MAPLNIHEPYYVPGLASGQWQVLEQRCLNHSNPPCWKLKRYIFINLTFSHKFSMFWPEPCVTELVKSLLQEGVVEKISGQNRIRMHTTQILILEISGQNRIIMFPNRYKIFLLTPITNNKVCLREYLTTIHSGRIQTYDKTNNFQNFSFETNAPVTFIE